MGQKAAAQFLSLRLSKTALGRSACFTLSPDKHGGGPQGSLTMDAAGNLYGTTYKDGAYATVRFLS